MPEPADRPPSLRDRLAEALRKAAYVCPGDGCPHDENTCGVGEPIVLAAATYIDGEPEGTLIDGEVTAIADAVMPVVEAETAEAAQRYRGVAEGLQVELRAAIKAQGEAERERDQARDAIADERRGRLAAEAAVRRARAAAEDLRREVGPSHIVTPYVLRILYALDAEQPKEETR